MRGKKRKRRRKKVGMERRGRGLFPPHLCP